MKFFLPILLASTICGSALNAAEINGSRFSSGPWIGAAYSDDVTGEFGYCSISAFYQHNNTELYFSLNKNYTMTLAVFDQMGRFPSNQNSQVTVRVDSRAPFYGNAYFANENMAFLTLTNMDVALNAMRRGNTLRLEGLYGSFDYGLNGTFRALDAAYQCASTYYNYQSASNAAPTPETFVPTRDQERRMYQLSSAIAADFGISGIVYRENHPTMLVWDTNDGSMWVGTAIGRKVGNEISLADEFGSDMGNLSQFCDGALATVQSDFDANGIATTETDAQCMGEAGDMKFNAHIIRQVIDNELVEIVIYMDGSAIGNTQSRSQPDTAIGEAAALISASFSR